MSVSMSPILFVESGAKVETTRLFDHLRVDRRVVGLCNCVSGGSGIERPVWFQFKPPEKCLS